LVLDAIRADGGIDMFRDPVVEEVRAVRQRHTAKFQGDLDAIVADLREKEKHLGRPVVSLAAKRRPVVAEAKSSYGKDADKL
jgi:hypothetical protein